MLSSVVTSSTTAISALGSRFSPSNTQSHSSVDQRISLSRVSCKKDVAEKQCFLPDKSKASLRQDVWARLVPALKEPMTSARGPWLWFVLGHHGLAILLHSYSLCENNSQGERLWFWRASRPAEEWSRPGQGSVPYVGASAWVQMGTPGKLVVRCMQSAAAHLYLQLKAPARSNPAPVHC
ncbi:hypothetical protein DNTS_033297 [Danionella cerebrum]|uniref:Uncharacterized protein n=1 Tax=Danionella cerebrum TaxID=2873325 RepID=A0A553NAP0_9TELE|nr:hypothetical protein DNTS_033297 [Danionella translucida]